MKGFFLMEQLYPCVIFNDITKGGVCQEKIKEQLQILNKRKTEQEKIIPIILTAWKENKLYSEEKQKRLEDCGSIIGFNEHGEMSSANFCKDKLCPICQWRKSRRVFGEIMQIQKIVENNISDFALLTLTLKNTNSLSEGICDIMKGFYNFSNNRTFKKVSEGYIRTVEITYNNKLNNWHPHIHLVVALKENYYSENFIKTEKWSDIWGRSARLDYAPIVDMRAIGQSLQMREKAVAEVAKYAIKPFQTKGDINAELNAYIGLYGGTKNRRLRSFGGIYAKARKLVPERDEVDLNGSCEIFFRRESGEYVNTQVNIRQTEICQMERE